MSESQIYDRILNTLGLFMTIFTISGGLYLGMLYSDYSKEWTLGIIMLLLGLFCCWISAGVKNGNK